MVTAKLLRAQPILRSISSSSSLSQGVSRHAGETPSLRALLGSGELDEAREVLVRDHLSTGNFKKLLKCHAKRGDIYKVS